MSVKSTKTCLWTISSLLALTTSVVATQADTANELVDFTWEVPAPARRLGQVTLAQIPEQLDVRFQINGSEVEVRLLRNRALLPSSMRHVLHHPDGSLEEGPLPEPCFYVGEAQAANSTGPVSFSTCQGGFSGMVLLDGQALLVEPSHKLSSGRALQGAVGRALHSVRRLQEADALEMFGDVQNFLAPKGAEARRLSSGASTKHVEVVVVNDNSRYNSFGGQMGLPALAAHSASVMNIVSSIYRKAPDSGAFPYTIQIVLVAQHTFLQPDPWDSVVKTGGSETEVNSLLMLFLGWSSVEMSSHVLPANDNRVLLSGRDFDGSTIGYAGMSTMCNLGRSGSINMCSNSQPERCAATVAHELGHNFGMNHDGAGNDCSSSGTIMEAVGGGPTPDAFSGCSVNYVTNFFQQVYPKSQCLENRPTRVAGDPVCQNGFVEQGEDCDCGAADCSAIDPCCNGATCSFASPSYECSDAIQGCCKNCMKVSASANHICRAAQNSCDLPETCPGGIADCPQDVYAYPGQACSVDGFAGLCSLGSCVSMDYTCSVDVNRDFSGSWDLTETCAQYNDDCNIMICHKGEYPNDATKCGQNFVVHDKQMSVPDGTPCWHPSSPKGTRTGMCVLGNCTLAYSLAVVPTCGNGGIDYGEQCDCGSQADPCCDCSTCQLHSGKQCSSHEACCEASTCLFKASGTMCRAAADSCDLAESCTGTSGRCPTDLGTPWGTSCSGGAGLTSTCYAKRCVNDLNTQCSILTGGVRPFAKMNIDGGHPRTFTEHHCPALYCCMSCDVLPGTVNIGGVRYSNPTLCNSCSRLTSWSTFTVTTIDGTTTNKIYLGAVEDGTVLQNSGQMCIRAEETTPANSCSSREYLEVSTGHCVRCNAACSACTGPSPFDCVDACAYGPKDSRGSCPFSSEQLASSLPAPSPVPTPVPGAVPTPVPGAVPVPTPSPTPSFFAVLDGSFGKGFVSWLGVLVAMCVFQQ